MSPDIPEPVAEALEQQYASFARREPAVLTGLVGGSVLGAFTALSDAGIIGPGEASGLAATATGLIVGAGVAATGFVVRRYVRPAWKRYTGRDLPD